MKYIDLSNLSHKGKFIDWINSIGTILPFQFNDIIGELQIINYNNSFVTLLYNNESFTLHISDVKKCNINKILGFRTSNFKYDVNEILSTQHGQIKIIKQIRLFNSKAKGYIYECLTCHTLQQRVERNIINKANCNVCNNHKMIVGINDMWTTNPEIATLLLNKQDGFKYLVTSSLRTDFICPICNSILYNKLIGSVKSKGLQCKYCSDGVSYPEKFVCSMLKQLNIEFDKEVKFVWSDNKRYDFYIYHINTILEVHGMQHYKYNSFKLMGGQSLQSIIDNDKYKYNLAQTNHISNYIIINAMYSELDYIKNNIINSNFSQLYNLYHIDWLKCHNDAHNSLIDVAVRLWNKGYEITKISKLMHLHRFTISRYLKQGAVLHLCDYIPKVGGVIKSKRHIASN
jgi:DNA-directed RNA polymerase subunit M/transcription elongation factor TFIIS